MSTVTVAGPTGTRTRGLLGAHWLMLRTRGGLILLALGVLVPLAVLVLVLLTGQQTFDVDGADLADPLINTTVACALFAPLLGAMIGGSPFRHGTIVPLLLAEPRRTRVVLAAVLVAGGVAAMSAVLYILLGSAVALPWLANQGVPVGEVLADPALWWRLLGSTAVVAVTGMFGAALGALLRGLLGPVLVLVGSFIVEGSVIAYVNDEWLRWSLWANLVVLTEPTAELPFPFWQSVLFVVGVLAAVVAAALVSTTRRDAA